MISWFGKKKESFDIYQPKERLIYSYFNGKVLVKADPIILYKKIMDCGPELHTDLKIANTELPIKPKEKIDAHNNAIEKVKIIFNLESLSEGGLSQLETIDLLDHFLTYCDQLKKNSNQLSISSNNLEDSKISTKGNQVTPNSLDSGSIEKEVSTVKLEPSPLG